MTDFTINQGSDAPAAVISADSIQNPGVAASIPVFNPPPTPTIYPPTPTTDSGISPDMQKILSMYQEPTNPVNDPNNPENNPGLLQKRQNVQNLQDQINGILSSQRVQEAQGKDFGTSAGGIQARNYDLEKQNYLTLQPLQAQLAAEQGNLDLAQTHLDNLFKYQQDYQSKLLDYNNKKIDAVYDFATKQQQAQLDAKKLQNEQDFTISQNNLNYLQTLSQTAIENGAGNLVSQIAQVNSNDPNFNQKVSIIASKIPMKPNASLMKLGNETSPTTVQQIQAQTISTFQQYKDAGYTRKQIEDQYKTDNGITTIPPLVKNSLDSIFGQPKGWLQSGWDWFKNAVTLPALK